jgi:ATP-dependent protease ClpP protease subunit
MEVEHENQERAVFLTSTIDIDTYERLAPEIIRLRLASSQPICLYIHSLGGTTTVAERLLRLMRSPRQDGNRCMVTTVCMGMAASAASDLLASGDYAIAYSDSVILVHGTREEPSEFTVEKLRETAEGLEEANEYFATKLASRMFRRFAAQSLLLAAYKTTPPSTSVVAVKVEPIQLLGEIRDNVQPVHQKLVDDAFDRLRRITDLVKYTQAMQTPGATTTDQLVTDNETLKKIIDFETEALKQRRQNGETITRFPQQTISAIQDDFQHLSDFLYGAYYDQSLELSREKGHYFLTENELGELRKIPHTDKEARKKFMETTATPRVFPLWYLVVSLCRLLQQGEHVFTAEDAWWFGLVDEVLGSELPSMRLFREEKRRQKQSRKKIKPPTTVPSTDSMPPAEQSPPAT